MAQAPIKPPNNPHPAPNPAPARGPVTAEQQAQDQREREKHEQERRDQTRQPKPKTGVNDPLHGLSDQERRDRTEVSDDNPLKELAQQQREDQEKRKERDEDDGKSLAERETLATGERRLRQAGAVAGDTYLQSRADNERAQIEERVEEQAAAKRHAVTGEAVIVTGVPPRADMRRDDDDIDEEVLPPSTREEMKAGRDGLKNWEARDRAEHEAGRKALQDHARQHPDEPDPRRIPPRQDPKVGHSEE